MVSNCFHRFDCVVFVFCVGFAFLGHSPARAQHSDVFVTSVGGQVAIGGANDLGTVEEHFDLDTRLFEGVLIPSFPPFDPADYGRDEPGFHAEPSSSLAFPPGASALPNNAAVTVNLPAFSVGAASDSLFYWSGVGIIDFQPITSAQPGVVFSLDPNPIGSSGAGGGFDLHPVFELDNGGAGVPADGVYLIAPTASVAGLGDSRPFYMVWLADALIVDEEAAEELEEALEMGHFVVHGKDFGFFEEAVDYVHDNLVVPEPSALILLVSAVGSCGAIFVPRRRCREA